MTTTILMNNQKASDFSSALSWHNCALVIAASFFLSLCAQIKLDLPFTLVPLTLQTLGVLLVGVSLGAKRTALAVVGYYSQVLMGLPVLAGGISDPLIFIGPKAGYVFGFIVQGYLMGWFAEQAKASKLSYLFIGGLVASVIQLGLGVAVLSLFVGWNAVWIMGFWPFVPGAILKVIFMCMLTKKITN